MSDWFDGQMALASPVGAPVFSSPIPTVSTAYVLDQKYQIRRLSFASLALNTAHSTYTDFRLVFEGPREDIGGGMVEWLRRYAKVPVAHYLPETVPYHFIGFWGTYGVNITAITGRPRFTKAVPCKVCLDYWIVDGSSQTDPIAGGSPIAINAVTDIPLIAEQKYLVATGSTYETDWIADSPPFSAATSPSRTAYDALVAADAFNICIETSRVVPWQGNIFQRQTRYVKAQ